MKLCVSTGNCIISGECVLEYVHDNEYEDLRVGVYILS